MSCWLVLCLHTVGAAQSPLSHGLRLERSDTREVAMSALVKWAIVSRFQVRHHSSPVFIVALRMQSDNVLLIEGQTPVMRSDSDKFILCEEEKYSCRSFCLPASLKKDSLHLASLLSQMICFSFPNYMFNWHHKGKRTMSLFISVSWKNWMFVSCGFCPTVLHLFFFLNLW